MPKPPTDGPSTGVLLARLSDRALFVRAAEDERAFAELVNRYREPLRRHAARYVGDGDAEDVVQQALVNASLAIRREPDRDVEPKPWLYKVTTNAAIDHRRAAAARPLGDRTHEEPDFDALSGPAGADPHDVVEAREGVRSLVERMMGLAPNQRRAAAARFLEGRSHDEIAGELGVTKGAARELIHRARLNLREAMPALSPLPLFEKLRHAFGAMAAGATPVAKFTAGAALVAVAAGGSAAVLANRDAGDVPSVGAGGVGSPAAAISTIPTVAAEPRGGAAGGANAAAARAGANGTGSTSETTSSAAGADAAATGTTLGAAAAQDPAGTGAGSPADVVQGIADDLGLGGITNQLPSAPNVPNLPNVPNVPNTPSVPNLPDTPSAPNTGLPGAG
jgi:RNA polymerase sigma factor (sigma-70 family)